MKKIIYLIVVHLLTAGCAHRGLTLSDQIPQKFIEEAKTNTPKGYELIGVIKEGSRLNDQNITFASDSAKQKFQRKASQIFHYQLVDSSGGLEQFNISLKNKANNINVSRNQRNEIDRIEINGFDFVRVSSPAKDSALLVRSYSTKKFIFTHDFGYEGVLAH